MRRRCLALITCLLCLLCSMPLLPAAADTAPAVTALSLDDAVAMALKASKTVKQAELDLDRADKSRDYWQDVYGWQLQKTYDPMSQLYANVPSTQDSYPAFVSADREYFFKQKSLAIAQEAAIIDVYTKYFDVLKALESEKAAETALARDEALLGKTGVLVQVGMAPQSALTAARAQRDVSRAALVTAQNQVGDAYRALNELIGLAADARPALSSAAEFKSLADDALAAKLNEATSKDTNPTLWVAYEGYDMSRYLWSYTVPDEAGRVDIDKAYLSYEQARDKMRDLVNSLYGQLRNLEAAHISAEQGVALAEENLKIAQAKFSVGMVTSADVKAAEAALEAARKALLEVEAGHAALAKAFEKPWAYISLMSQSGAGDSSSTDDSGDDSGYGG